MSHHFTDLERVTDDVHALFDAWAAAGRFADVLGPEGADVLRLAVHEWVANLVQHASFPDGARISLDVEATGAAVRVAIEDSSAGFDFGRQLERQREILDAPAPSERGRGLLMLVTCAEDLAFRPAADGVAQRIAFSVRPPGDALFAPFFRDEDLATAPPPAYAGDGLAGALPRPSPGPDPDTDSA